MACHQALRSRTSTDIAQAHEQHSDFSLFLYVCQRATDARIVMILQYVHLELSSSVIIAAAPDAAFPSPRRDIIIL